MTRRDYVSSKDLFGWDPLGGASVTVTLPRIDGLGPRYVKGLHGFRPPDNGDPPIFDTPSTILIFDARTGKFLEQQEVRDEYRMFPIEILDRDAQERLGPAQDRLAPHFFDGVARVPRELESLAEAYRADFPRATQSGHRAFYETHARGWMAWVGLL